MIFHLCLLYSEPFYTDRALLNHISNPLNVHYLLSMIAMYSRCVACSLYVLLSCSHVLSLCLNLNNSLCLDSYQRARIKRHIRRRVLNDQENDAQPTQLTASVANKLNIPTCRAQSTANSISSARRLILPIIGSQLSSSPPKKNWDTQPPLLVG